MSTSASLLQLLHLNASINSANAELISITNKYDQNAEKLKDMQNLETKFQKAFDDAQNEDKTCKVGTKTWKEKDQVLSDAMAYKYAQAKVAKFDEEVLKELEEIDFRWESQKINLETKIQLETAQRDAIKETVGTGAGDTKIIGSGGG